MKVGNKFSIIIIAMHSYIFCSTILTTLFQVRFSKKEILYSNDNVYKPKKVGENVS